MPEGTPDPKDTTGKETPADPVKNVKAEMDRKLGNIETTVQQLAQTNQALAAQLQKMQEKKPESTGTQKPWKDRFYENEDAALNEVEENATRRATEAMRNLQAIEQRKQNAVNQMVNDYPELAIESPLKAKSVEIFNALSKEEQADPNAIKLAVREAAADLGMLPKSKRKEEVTDNDDDTFSLSGKGGSEGKKGRRGQKSGDLAQETLDFAELLGRPVDDEKYIARLKKANERSNWSKFKPVKGK